MSYRDDRDALLALAASLRQRAELAESRLHQTGSRPDPALAEVTAERDRLANEVAELQRRLATAPIRLPKAAEDEEGWEPVRVIASFLFFLVAITYAWSRCG